MRGSERLRTLALIVAAVTAAGGMALAQSGDDPTARLRAALRDATAQVRQLEDQNATLQAKQAELERDRQGAVQKATASEKELQALRSKGTANLDALQHTADAQKESLAKWEAAYKDAAGTAQTRDADAKRLEAANVALREKNRQLEEKNAKLFQIGQDLVDLYQKKKVLDVVGDGEPFTKLRRVEDENVVQDFEDKLRENRVAHPEPR
jgi:chromosome segregation ATPase